MHLIHLHIGDFQDATKRYEPEAIGIYLQLLFEYYKTEKALPSDIDELKWLCGVRTKNHLESLKLVLKRCFTLSEDGQSYVQKRCEREIINYRANCIQNRYAILCRHWEKVNKGIQRPTYEDFAAEPSRYYDDSTKRLRPVTARNATVAPSKGHRNTDSLQEGYPPVTSNQEPVTSNQERTPIVPKGTVLVRTEADAGDPEADDQTPNLFDQTSESDIQTKPQKKKGGGADASGFAELPAEWSDARRAIVGEWFSHRLGIGKFITPEQFAALIASTSSLTDAQLRACVDDAMAKHGELAPHKFTGNHRDMFDASTWHTDIYNAYPRKEAKPRALRAIEKAIRVAKITPQDLLKRTQLYAIAVAKWGEARYTVEGSDTVPHPATWFNGHCFNDDPSLWEKRPRSSPKKGEGAAPSVEETPVEAEPIGWQEAFAREFGSPPSMPWSGLHPTTQATVIKRMDEEAMKA